MIARMIAASLAVGANFLAHPAATAAPVPFSVQKSVNCPADESCSIPFQRLSATIRWELRQVSCFMNVAPASAKPIAVGLQVEDGAGEPVALYPLVPETTGVAINIRIWVVQSQVYAPLQPGQRARFISTINNAEPTFYSISCTLAGTREQV